jgi:hypothetical protein
VNEIEAELALEPVTTYWTNCVPPLDMLLHEEPVGTAMPTGVPLIQGILTPLSDAIPITIRLPALAPVEKVPESGLYPVAPGALPLKEPASGDAPVPLNCITVMSGKFALDLTVIVNVVVTVLTT